MPWIWAWSIAHPDCRPCWKQSFQPRYEANVLRKAVVAGHALFDIKVNLVCMQVVEDIRAKQSVPRADLAQSSCEALEGVCMRVDLQLKLCGMQGGKVIWVCLGHPSVFQFSLQDCSPVQE